MDPNGLGSEVSTSGAKTVETIELHNEDSGDDAVK